MEYRQLGDSGLRVSGLGLGGNPFGRDVDEGQAARIIHHALDLGVNYVDTANIYALGVSEQYVGKALAGVRQQVLLGSKVGKTRGTMGDAINNRGLSRKHISDSVEASLRRLATDYLDLYQLHEPDETTPIEETLRALDDLVHAGKVRYLGYCNVAAWQLSDALWTAARRALTPMVSVQSRYNVVDRTIERDVLACCRHFGIGIIAHSPLAEGLLTGKYRPGEGVPDASRLARNPQLPGLAKAFSPARRQQASGLTALAQEYGRSPSQLALAWLLAHPEVSTVIAGATRTAQLDDNVQAAAWKLGPDDQRRVDEAVGLGADK